MTNTPDLPTPGRSVTTDGDAAAAASGSVSSLSDSAPVVSAPAGASVPGPGPDPVLDRGTYDRVREPRRRGGLPLGEGTWHQISRSYVRVELISNGALLLIVVAAMLVLALLLRQTWAWIPGGILSILLLWVIVITPRRARSIAYRLRRDDLVFRRGILWQRSVAVPYGRMQLVDITHGPLDRGFGIAQLKLVTAAAATSVTIPGLTQEAAEQLRDTLIDVAETRRTGL